MSLVLLISEYGCLHLLAFLRLKCSQEKVFSALILPYCLALLVKESSYDLSLFTSSVISSARNVCG